MGQISSEEVRQTLATESVQNRYSRLVWGLLIVVVIAAIAGYYFLNRNHQVTQYNTVFAQQKDLVVTVSATGNLQPTNRVDVGIEVSGTILAIYADFNDRVEKGQRLAILDTTKLASQVKSTKAALSVVKANLLASEISIKESQKELERLESLYQSTHQNFPTKKELDAASIAYKKALAAQQAIMAQKQQAQAQLESNEEDLKKAIVISPINGIVLNRTVEAGQSVAANMQVPILFTLAEDLKKMEVIVSVDEADVGAVRAGQAVDFTVDAYPDKVFKGVIKQVRLNSQIVNNVVTYETVVTVDNSDLLLRPGMTVSADITTQVVKDALLVPTSALRFAPRKQTEQARGGFMLFGRRHSTDRSDVSAQKNLWLLKDGQAVSVPVELGESDGLHTVILSDNISLEDAIILSEKEPQK